MFLLLTENLNNLILTIMWITIIYKTKRFSDQNI